MNLEDFEIFPINTKNLLYKSKNILTGDVYYWQKVLLKGYTLEQKQQFCAEINNRKEIKHPNILRFFGYIEDSKKGLVYISKEYCKHGTLSNFMQEIKGNKESLYASEELICRIIFQLAYILKSVEIHENLNLNSLFLDENFTLKFNNFAIKTQTEALSKDYGLESCLKSVCAFFLEKEKLLGQLYSDEFKSFISTLENVDVFEEYLNRIFCNKLIIQKSAQWTVEQSLVKGKNLNLHKILSDDYTSRLQNLRNKEISLKIWEEKLEAKERNLVNREKKIALMERLIKDKMVQAELYLKRSKETKSGKGKIEKENYDIMDSSYSADCGQSVLVETSKKLNLHNIKPFNRTFSERRVKFKGHSPLKNMDFTRRSSKFLKPHSPCKQKITEVSSEASKSDLSSKSVPLKKHSRSLFSSSITSKSDNDNENVKNSTMCRPISWTEESKKFAFDLLRIMNNSTNRDQTKIDVKHTYL